MAGDLEGALTVIDVIRSLMPDGTNPIRKTDTWAEGFPVIKAEWDSCPSWPPDAFATAATLAERSGCYSELGVVLSGSEADRRRKNKDRVSAERIGRRWAQTGTIPKAVTKLWTILVAAGDEVVCSGSGDGRGWKVATMRLLAICDEACSEVGTTPNANSSRTVGFVANQFALLFSAGPTPSSVPAYLHYLPNSLARAIPPSRACVLPKGLTPALGCTLRSVTHHLALLPGSGHVTAEWRLSVATSRAPKEPFNLLVVPYPYVVGGNDISMARAPDRRGMDGYFAVRPRVLPADNDREGLPAFIRFLSALIRQAERDGGSVGGVVLPEGALWRGDAELIVAALAGEHRGLELFVAGTILPLPTRGGSFSFDRNEAFVARLSAGKIVDRYSQAKHHRWRLDEGQIHGYGLGHLLDPAENWWEAIDVSNRRIVFGVDDRGWHHLGFNL